MLARRTPPPPRATTAASTSGGASAAASAPPPPRPPLIVVGSANADLVLRVDRLPAPGETLNAHSLDTVPGGKGANQAAAAARLGYPSYFVGATGTDANAELLRGALAESGVRLGCLRRTEGPTGTAVILLQPSGENSIIIAGGANQDPRSWEGLGTAASAASSEAAKLIASAGAVLLQREVPESANLAAARAAAAARVPVFLDAGGADAPLPQALLECVTLLSPNETELARLTGMPTGTRAEVEAAARALMARGVEQVLVKLGADGALLLPGADAAPVAQPAIKAPKVVDTTGAGDCFTAAYAVAVLEGRAPADALRFAAAAGSLCVRRAGAMPSLPWRGEVDELLASGERVK